MNPLQYTSEEMFSSTELIRKSKMVFDKLHNNEIEKAIILRDGKPSFMLLDFNKYEELMSEYLSLKEFLDSNDKTNSKHEKKVVEEIEITKDIIKKEEKPQSADTSITELKEINEKDLEDALAQIDNLDLNSIGKEEDMSEEEKLSKKSLKEFWE